jgi:hypothetical protein
MYECNDLGVDDYLNISIASSVMSRLANWALIVAFAYILNSMLLKQLQITSSGSKTVFRIIIGVMAVAMIADLALSSYVTTSNKYYDFDYGLLILTSYGLSLTVYILWLISVIISAAFSLSNISALRSRRLPGGVSPRQTLSTDTFANKSVGPHWLGNRPLYRFVRLFRVGSRLLILLLLARSTFTFVGGIIGFVVHLELVTSYSFHNSVVHCQTRLLGSDDGKDRPGVCTCHTAASDVRLRQWTTGLLSANARACTCQMSG